MLFDKQQLIVFFQPFAALRRPNFEITDAQCYSHIDDKVILRTNRPMCDKSTPAMIEGEIRSGNDILNSADLVWLDEQSVNDGLSTIL